jgi:hypothetical protein
MTYRKLNDRFNIYLNDYIQTNGVQTTDQVRVIAKNYAIQQRNGEYDLTAKNYYCSLFISYLWKNNIELEGWSRGLNIYDPDNEFPDDIRLQRLREASDKRRTSSIIKNIKDMARDGFFNRE